MKLGVERMEQSHIESVSDKTHTIPERDAEGGCVSSQRWGLMGTGNGKPSSNGIHHAGVWHRRGNACGYSIVITQQAAVVRIMDAGVRLPRLGFYLCHLVLADFGLVTLSLGLSFLIGSVGAILRTTS